MNISAWIRWIKLPEPILAGGIAEFYNIITEQYQSMIDSITEEFQQVVSFINVLKQGLAAIGCLDVIDFINGRDRTSHNEEYIKISDGNGNYGHLTSREHDLLVSGGGLEDLMDALQSSSIRTTVESLRDSITTLRDSFSQSNSGRNVMAPIIDALRRLLNTSAREHFRNFLEKVDSVGSIQFLVSGEIDMILEMVFEIGVSIDVRQLLYFMDNGRWDRRIRQVAALHVGYAIDAGAQAGADMGFAIAYHTSSVTDVDGFDWGFNLEGAAGYSAGLGVAWSLPGSHIPNQFIAQIIGAGAKLEMSAFVNHGITLGYIDSQIGFIPAAPSIAMARLSGNPSLFYSRYSWQNLGVSFSRPSAQYYWYRLGWRGCSWDTHTCENPATSTMTWNQLSYWRRRYAYMLGYTPTTWNAPVASRGWQYDHPLEDYFRNFQWTNMLTYERDLFRCLGWTQSLFDDDYRAPDDWTTKWVDLPFEKQLCATAIGYCSIRWNTKPRIPRCNSNAVRSIADGRECSRDSNCHSSSACVGRWSGAPTLGCLGTCTPKAADFQSCPGGTDSSCQSGVCTCGKCGRRQHDESWCGRDSDCESRNCESSFLGITAFCTGRCRPDIGPKSAVLHEWKESVHAMEIETRIDIPTDCIHNKYKVDLYSFKSHFFLGATKTGEGNDSCPPALVFASLQGRKVTYRVPQVQALSEGFNHHMLGEADLNKILYIESTVEAIDDSAYDLTQNTCAHYAQRIWRGLDFDETTLLADFLVDSLLRDEGLVEYAKENLDRGGKTVLSYFAGDGAMFEKYVNEMVMSQLIIKE